MASTGIPRRPDPDAYRADVGVGTDVRTYEERPGSTDSYRTVSAESQSVSDLVREVAGDVSQLMRQELELAKAEMKEDAKAAGKGAGMLGGAGLAGWLALLFASLAAMWGLTEVMHVAWAALIVTAIWGIAAALLYSRGRRQLTEMTPGPEQAIQSLKEDIEEGKQWARRRSS